jgi:integrase
MHLHSGRHTSAAWQLEQGISPHIVSARLGHSDAGFTLKTYAKSLPAADKQATQILEAALADLIRNENGRIAGAQDALMAQNLNT